MLMPAWDMTSATSADFANLKTTLAAWQATYAQALAYAATLVATPDTPVPSSGEAAPAPPAAARPQGQSVDTRGLWATDNPAVSTPTRPGDDGADAPARHAPRGFPRGTNATEHARRAGLTPAQYHLLRAVRAHPAYPAVTIAALAERLGIRHQSASWRVAHAVARGLLHRHPATDRRLVLVALTDAGVRALDRVTRAAYEETATPRPPRCSRRPSPPRPRPRPFPCLPA